MAAYTVASELLPTENGESYTELTGMLVTLYIRKLQQLLHVLGCLNDN